MTEKILLELLRGYKNNSVSEVEILERLKNLPYDAVEDLGFANVDHHRELRQGFPEVIYAEGKTAEQVAEIFQRLYERSEGNLIATRASREKFDFVAKKFPPRNTTNRQELFTSTEKKLSATNHERF